MLLFNASCIAVLAPLSLLTLQETGAETPQAAEEAESSAGRWSQWRGPDRSGHCPGPAWPAELKEQNLSRQWRVEAGPSYSGPIVDDERVYTTATVDEEREVVTAYDRESGEELWSRSWEGAMKVPFFAARNGSWIRSTPALDEGRLFVAGMLDVLVCLEAKTGEVEWTLDFPATFDTKPEDFGFVCSPLVWGAHVYVHTGSGLFKLEKSTGKVVWRSLHDDEATMMNRGAFSSPVFATLAGSDQLIVQGREILYGLDPESGEVLWNVPVKTFRGMNILTPVPWEDGVFTSAYGGRAHFFTLEVQEDGELVPEQAWTNRAQGYMSTPVVIDGFAYIYQRSKRLACVDLVEGTVAWISEPIGDEYWSLVAQGDRILALSESGELHLVAANPERYELLASLPVSESETWAHLAVDDDQLFVRELDGLTAFSWKEAEAGQAE